jgi:hypothetical protein
MISEVDIRDWDRVDFTPFHKNPAGQQKVVPYFQVLQFVADVQAIRDKQIKDARNRIPALFKKGEE